jgi:hypothetical protein
MRTLIISIGSLLLGACSATIAPVPTTPASSLVCEAMRPSFPMSYHGGKAGPGGDTIDTITRIRVANARFIAACP